jgi:hypothetical protein
MTQLVRGDGLIQMLNALKPQPGFFDVSYQKEKLLLIVDFTSFQ